MEEQPQGGAAGAADGATDGAMYLDVVPAEQGPIGADVPRGEYVVDNHKYTSREKVRLLTLKPGVQATIVICALIDFFMLLAQVRRRWLHLFLTPALLAYTHRLIG